MNLRDILKITSVAAIVTLVGVLLFGAVTEYKVGQCISMNDVSIQELKKKAPNLPPMDEMFLRALVFKVVRTDHVLYVVRLVQSMSPVSQPTYQLLQIYSSGEMTVNGDDKKFYDEVSCPRERVEQEKENTDS